MNIAAAVPQQWRRAASPYARRLARENGFDLVNLTGSGPDGRIVATDILLYRASDLGSPMEQKTAPLPKPVMTFSAVVLLADLFRLAAEAARVGIEIAVEDAASRAARAAFVSMGINSPISIEVDGRQIIIETASGLSISAERRLRLAAMSGIVDASKEPAAASLQVLQSARVMPMTLPLLAGRSFRFVLAVDRIGERAHVLICADSDAVPVARAMVLLEAFVVALERPLGLLA